MRKYLGYARGIFAFLRQIVPIFNEKFTVYGHYIFLVHEKNFVPLKKPKASLKIKLSFFVYSSFKCEKRNKAENSFCTLFLRHIFH